MCPGKLALHGARWPAPHLLVPSRQLPLSSGALEGFAPSFHFLRPPNLTPGDRTTGPTTLARQEEEGALRAEKENKEKKKTLPAGRGESKPGKATGEGGR